MRLLIMILLLTSCSRKLKPPIECGIIQGKKVETGFEVNPTKLINKHYLKVNDRWVEVLRQERETYEIGGEYCK